MEKKKRKVTTSQNGVIKKEENKHQKIVNETSKPLNYLTITSTPNFSNITTSNTNSPSIPLKQQKNDDALKKPTINAEDLDDMESVRQRAELIAAAAAGTPLPPLSSLTPDEQRQYFEWIKRLPVNASTPTPPIPTNASPLPFTAAEWFSDSNSLPKDTLNFMSGYAQPSLSSIASIGAIGSGRPRNNNNISPKQPTHLTFDQMMLQTSESPMYFSQPSLNLFNISTINNDVKFASTPQTDDNFADFNESNGIFFKENLKTSF